MPVATRKTFQGPAPAKMAQHAQQCPLGPLGWPDWQDASKNKLRLQIPALFQLASSVFIMVAAEWFYCAWLHSPTECLCNLREHVSGSSMIWWCCSKRLTLILLPFLAKTAADFHCLRQQNSAQEAIGRSFSPPFSLKYLAMIQWARCTQTRHVSKWGPKFLPLVFHTNQTNLYACKCGLIVELLQLDLGHVPLTSTHWSSSVFFSAHESAQDSFQMIAFGHWTRSRGNISEWTTCRHWLKLTSMYELISHSQAVAWAVPVLKYSSWSPCVTSVTLEGH